MLVDAEASADVKGWDMSRCQEGAGGEGRGRQIQKRGERKEERGDGSGKRVTNEG